MLIIPASQNTAVVAVYCKCNVLSDNCRQRNSAPSLHKWHADTTRQSNHFLDSDLMSSLDIYDAKGVCNGIY